MAQSGGSPPPSGGGGGADPNKDSGMGIFWVFTLVAIAGFIVWKTAKTYIVTFVFKVKLLQAYAISIFTDNINKAIIYLETAVPADVSFKDLANVSEFVGTFVRYPVMAILVAIAIVLYFSNMTMRFRKTHNMASLREQESTNWPQIIPILKLDLANKDLNQGPWATAMTPMQFCQQHDLLKPNDIGKANNEPYADIVAGLKRGQAHSVFTMQLGSLWQSFTLLPKHTKAIFALLAAKANRDRDGCTQLLVQMARSTATGTIDYHGIDELLAKHVNNNKKISRLFASHAYVLTVMASLIELAREDGVFATADFLWLKPIDRHLWYMLNTVGRQTPFVEVAGPFAHWKIEKALGQKIITPMVDEAVKGLELAIAEVKLSPEVLAEIEENATRH